MTQNTPPKLTYGITTSLLFDMSKENKIFNEKGEADYADYMLSHADKPLPLSRGFAHLENELQGNEFVDVVLCSRNSPLTARRALLTLENHGITPERMFFMCGASPVPYLKAYDIDIFMTTHKQDAQDAKQLNGVLPLYYEQTGLSRVSLNVLEGGKSSNKVHPIGLNKSRDSSLKQAYNGKTISYQSFDLDGVVFGMESEIFYRQHGLAAYNNYERAMKDNPMSKGKAFPILLKMTDINKNCDGPQLPFHISVVTARGSDAAIHAIETLHNWGIDVNGGAHFRSGTPKEPVLRVLQEQAKESGAGIHFYDDQKTNIDQGQNAGVLSGQVLQEDYPAPKNT